MPVQALGQAADHEQAVTAVGGNGVRVVRGKRIHENPGRVNGGGFVMAGGPGAPDDRALGRALVGDRDPHALPPPAELHDDQAAGPARVGVLERVGEQLGDHDDGVVAQRRPLQQRGDEPAGQADLARDAGEGPGPGGHGGSHALLAGGLAAGRLGPGVLRAGPRRAARQGAGRHVRLGTQERISAPEPSAHGQASTRPIKQGAGHIRLPQSISAINCSDRLPSLACQCLPPFAAISSMTDVTSGKSHRCINALLTSVTADGCTRCSDGASCTAD